MKWQYLLLRVVFGFFNIRQTAETQMLEAYY
jgi:hypothetical protein